ncbi:MAG: WYL domain-containing protein, partial [Planctomycetes bacterium]|nr:WYL domain-containing protein [Planctomycetota bacterium]
MNAKRLERLLKIIQALQTGRSQATDELAKSIGVSRRTVFRDLELLREAGLPYTYDHETRRYSTDRVTLLPPVTLTHGEALVLLMATRLLLNHEAVCDREAAVSAGLKVESMLPRNLQDYCGPMLEHVAFRGDPASDSTVIAASMPRLQMALAKRVKVWLKYDSYYHGHMIEVVVHPYRLVYIHRGWYLLAFTERESAVRTYKVERILQLRFLDEAYEPDPEFSIDRYFGNAWLMIRGDQLHHVKIRFQQKVAGNVDEICWHKTQRTSYEGDGSLIF